MIVRPKPNLIGVLTSLKGSIAKRIAWRSLMVTLLASTPTFTAIVSYTFFGLDAIADGGGSANTRRQGPMALGTDTA